MPTVCCRLADSGLHMNCVPIETTTRHTCFVTLLTLLPSERQESSGVATNVDSYLVKTAILAPLVL